MTKPVMKYGARKGKMSGMRCWIAKASARDIRIFPVPGADILRMHQNELESGFIIAPNPREANVLLVMGDLTDSLAQKAAVVYQQVPRPRVLIVAGPEPPHLPKPDVHLSLNNDFLDQALPEVRELLQHHAWSSAAEPWEPEFLVNLVEDSDNGDGHDHHNNENGDEDNESHDHDHSNGNEGGDHHHQGDDEDEDEDHCDDSDHNHNHDDEEDENGGHDHGDMDFMSMVAMTKDLPRPKDGLPMNRSEVHFGPFHPGLPGGLSVFMELDGDTVIEARMEDDLTARSFEKILPLEASELPDLLAELNPLTPQTYRLLAREAVDSALKDERLFSSNELIVLERERIGSHLNWLATFAKTVGNEWMHREAARWHALHRSEEVLPGKLRDFLEQIRSMPYFKMKLSVGRLIPDTLLHHLSGPAAKAAGKTEDARSGDEQYQSLGWEPVIKQENSAWGRLLVRLDEMEQSVDLINKAGKEKSQKHKLDFSSSGAGSAQVESPRGKVSLKLSIDDGKVQELHIETPSQPLAGLVPTLTEEAELSDALVQIVSLDISPWEVGLKSPEVK